MNERKGVRTVQEDKGIVPMERGEKARCPNINKKDRWSTVQERVISIKETGSVSESNRKKTPTQRSVKRPDELEETVIKRISWSNQKDQLELKCD